MSPTVSIVQDISADSTAACPEISSEFLVERVVQLYGQISVLESLKPSNTVNSLLTELVHVCTMPICININELSKDVEEVRYNLILLCAEAEYLLETHFSVLIGTLPEPLANLHLFPYYSNYKMLASMEFNALTGNNIPMPISKLAFVGSGPMPLSSIVLAKHHMSYTLFDNYDMDQEANSMASRLVIGDPELSKRMIFHTSDINDVGKDKLAEYDVIVLAALVGLKKEQKVRTIELLGRNMKPGAALLLRSAKGARSFLYPVVEEEDLANNGFKIICVIHPTNEVINSIILALKPTK
ncbi:nicotianamine synthase-like [Cryptomeria japonica]|uniref:nicotianamine synthase-like n=1 Tax=Cryptomeria japonica TaxID=3369 RepID=UPI0027DAAED2|nr:nicotianamine synthase-like [Cryptomeria japonica]XP_057843624.2 nicotianamine synthase-like [Cryptomeria japonica]